MKKSHGMSKWGWLVACLFLGVFIACSPSGTSEESASEEADQMAAEEMNEAGESATYGSDSNASTSMADKAGESDESEDPALPENSYMDDSGNIIYLSAEVQPAYPGGKEEMMKYLRKNLKYPSTAKNNKSEGTVMVEFVVQEDGSITNVKTVKPLEDEALNEEAVRVVSEMPTWAAGKQNGAPVHVKYTLPITFKLQ